MNAEILASLQAAPEKWARAFNRIAEGEEFLLNGRQRRNSPNTRSRPEPTQSGENNKAIFWLRTKRSAEIDKRFFLDPFDPNLSWSKGNKARNVEERYYAPKKSNLKENFWTRTKRSAEKNAMQNTFWIRNRKAEEEMKKRNANSDRTKAPNDMFWIRNRKSDYPGMFNNEGWKSFYNTFSAWPSAVRFNHLDPAPKSKTIESNSILNKSRYG